MLKINEPRPQLKDINHNDNFDERYNDLMQNRNIPLNMQINNKNIPLRNSNNEFDNPDFLDNYQSLETQISDILPEKMNTEIIQEEVIIKEKKYPEIKIFSSKRNNIQSSRYYYNYNLKKNDINSNDLNIISRIMIPIEDNYIFTLPILFLTIKELNYDITLELDHIIEKDKRRPISLPQS